jgi:hypothetical protein
MPNATNQPTTPCDPEYMDALESRAWLEAQREIAQNQNLIAKPDSVLEYTCFNKFLEHAARGFSVDGVLRPFSETNNWNGPPAGFNVHDDAGENVSLDITLDQVVRRAMASYLRGNFAHRFIGDRLGTPGKEAYDPTPTNNVKNVTQTYDKDQPDYGYEYTKREINTASFKDDAPTNPDPNTPAGQRPFRQYECDRMAVVWEQARCLNFMQFPGGDDPDHKVRDGFYDFPAYAKWDPRTLPETAAVCEAPTKPIQDAENSAFNGHQDTYTIHDFADDDPNETKATNTTPQEPFSDTTPYLEDQIVTHLDMIKPGACAATGIPTGITVKRPDINGGSPYPEVICTNPACAQVDANGKCGPSVSTQQQQQQ